jgi:hypothetical protein
LLDGHVTIMRDRHMQRVLVRRHEGRDRLEDLSGRDEGNIKTDLKDIRLGGCGLE